MPDVDVTLAALADPTRRAIVNLLGQQPRCSSEMADVVGTSRPAMSRHLRVLRNAQIVVEEIQPDDARVRVYHLQGDGLLHLREWLDEVESFWGDQLRSFKEHAETASEP